MARLCMRPKQNYGSISTIPCSPRQMCQFFSAAPRVHRRPPGEGARPITRQRAVNRIGEWVNALHKNQKVKFRSNLKAGLTSKKKVTPHTYLREKEANSMVDGGLKCVGDARIYQTQGDRRTSWINTKELYNQKQLVMPLISSAVRVTGAW